MHQYCEEGSNSPAKRPEFVDISLDKAKKSDADKDQVERCFLITNDIVRMSLPPIFVSSQHLSSSAM